MKRWKSLTAALCAAVLLCGFSAVPAFAYADGGEGENYGDPTMTEETTAPEPEPTIEDVYKRQAITYTTSTLGCFSSGFSKRRRPS